MLLYLEFRILRPSLKPCGELEPADPPPLCRGFFREVWPCYKISRKLTDSLKIHLKSLLYLVPLTF